MLAPPTLEGIANCTDKFTMSRVTCNTSSLSLFTPSVSKVFCTSQDRYLGYYGDGLLRVLPRFFVCLTIIFHPKVSRDDSLQNRHGVDGLTWRTDHQRGNYSSAGYESVAAGSCSNDMHPVTRMLMCPLVWQIARWHDGEAGEDENKPEGMQYMFLETYRSELWHWCVGPSAHLQVMRWRLDLHREGTLIQNGRQRDGTSPPDQDYCLQKWRCHWRREEVNECSSGH